ncbi:MAG: PHP domain-containing protein [Gemmatimonadales bacterium]|nr:MAG: PHP domain-containing protein [Gemmatimonadales bacterium]
MRVDLHMHTNRSDGVMSPEEVVAHAESGRLDVIAITDHDDASGVEPAREAARDREVTVLSGVELSATWEGKEVHILGYGVAPESVAIRTHGSRARARRTERMEGMLERLRGQGVEVEMEAVARAAGHARPMIGRPHLARALVDAGYAESVPRAFDTLIGDEHPAYIPTDLGAPAEVVATVREAGGVAVWAHPPMEQLDPLLPELVEAGLEGLEAFRPKWTRRRIRRVVAVADHHGLVVTGGSDWHGPERNGRVGDFWVPDRLVRGFLERLGVGGE